MKELKNKEIIIGLIALIILLVLAIVLIVKREFPSDTTKNEPVVVEELPIIETEDKEDSKKELSQENVPVPVETEEINVLDNLAIEETGQPVGIVMSSTEEARYHSEPVYKEYTGEEMWQLEEIYGYWDQHRLDAVDDLIHLPRVRTITNELKGTNCFYYCGEKDSKGKPHGKGLAVYADNAYYFGEWKNGKRSGMGRYWKTFPDKTATINGATGIMEHQYNGMWSNDYPNGEGHEHFTFDYSLASGDYAIANVIGNFKDGYYDGELYIMTVIGDDKFMEWEAEAERGTFLYCGDLPKKVTGKYEVWERYKEVEDYNENYRLMDVEDNKEFGIYGLKKRD